MVDELDPWWVVGFIEGEGTFCVSMPQAKNHSKCGFRVNLIFQVSQDDKKTIEKIKRFFGFGYMHPLARREIHWVLTVTGIANLQKVRSFFRKYPLQTKKKKDFEKFCKVLRMVEGGWHLKPEGILEIARIRETMNTKLTAEEDEILRHYYKTKTDDELSPTLKRSPKAISDRRLLLRLVKEQKVRKNELAKLLARGLSTREIAEYFAVSEDAIYYHKRKLGLMGRRRWTDREITFLKDNFGKKFSREIAEELERSIHAVREMAYNLGLKGCHTRKGMLRNRLEGM